MNIRASLSAFVLACACTMFAPRAADAALVIRDLNTPGDGLLTLDTNTGLEWLDLSATLGKSPLEGMALFPSFHMASRSEFESLLINAGIQASHLGNGTLYAEDLVAGQLLSDTIGVTVSAFNGAVEQISGRVMRANGTHYDRYFLEIRTPPATPTGTMSLYTPANHPLHVWGTPYANFMARTATSVPEPGTLMLLATGLIGLAGPRRRRR